MIGGIKIKGGYKGEVALSNRNLNTYITPEAISNITYHNYDRSGKNEAKKFNWKMQEMIKRLMYTSMVKAKSCETLLILHIPTYKYEMATNYDACNVNITNKMHYTMVNNRGPFVSIHNHPNNSFFSVLDLLSFLSYDTMLMCFVTGNSGKVIHVMLKDTVSYNYAIGQLVRGILGALVKMDIVDKYSTAKPYLKILNNLGIKYKTYYNR